jgi:penicillin-binding protein 1A
MKKNTILTRIREAAPDILKTLTGMIWALFQWIFSHKRIVFIYVPLATAVIVCAYTAIIYLSWLGNRSGALDRLSRYKLLIDRTEEQKKGYVYSYRDVDLSTKAVDLPTRIYDRNNEVIGEFFEQKREIVPYDFIPEWIIKGVIASEDRDFYSHHGVNYRGILRAVLVNIASMGVVQGGSTITQQLAKVLFTDMERSAKRKIYEAFCAREIERHYDKADILSMYLNLIYFGNGAYGVESAAKMFFGKSVSQCDEVECAMIVATISSPRLYSPISNLNNSVRKTKRILKSLVDAGYTGKEKADSHYRAFLKKWEVSFDGKDQAATSLIGNSVFSSYRINRAPFFNEQIRRVLVEKFGEDLVKKGGLSIYTTIDAVKQDAALESLRHGVSAQRDYHLKTASGLRNSAKAGEEAEKAANIEGALVSIDPFTGEIISYVGGYEFSVKNQNDNVSQIMRQPGSSFKPLIYCAAVQDGDITPSTILVDEEATFRGGYSPRNASREYSGKMTVRDALARSVNVIAVKVLDRAGYGTVMSYIRKTLDLPDSTFSGRFAETLSLALGAYEVSPLENCRLQSVILNGGDYIRPYGIRFVRDYNGNIVWNNEEEVLRAVRENREKAGKIIDQRASAVTISMLQGVFEKGGTGYYALQGRDIRVPIAGKTGTTSDYTDAWFVGYTPKLVTAVWIGNKKGAISLGRNRSGSSIAAPVWTEYTSRITAGAEGGAFPVPDRGVSRERICLDSGLVAPEGGTCPRTAYQLFYEGTEPGEFCPLHGRNRQP